MRAFLSHTRVYVPWSFASRVPFCAFAVRITSMMLRIQRDFYAPYYTQTSASTIPLLDLGTILAGSCQVLTKILPRSRVELAKILWNPGKILQGVLCQDLATILAISCLASFALIMFPFVFADLDECSLNKHKCGKNSECSNTPGHYTCSCEKGYRKRGDKCTGEHHELQLPVQPYILPTL